MSLGAAVNCACCGSILTTGGYPVCTIVLSCGNCAASYCGIHRSNDFQNHMPCRPPDKAIQLDEAFMIDCISKIKKLGSDQLQDIVGLIQDAWNFADERGNPTEIAKTILEILEPERVGKIVWRKRETS